MASVGYMTDEQIIQAVKDYMVKYPDANRSRVILKAAKTSQRRITDLEKAGKITLPKPLAKSASNHAWRKAINTNVKDRIK